MRNHYQLEGERFNVAAAAGVGAALSRPRALLLYFLFIFLFWTDNSSGIIIQSCTVGAARSRWGWGFA